MNRFKLVEKQTFTDADYFRIMVEIIFYAGFKAEIVDGKLSVIHRWLSDYKKVAGYGEAEVKAMMSDTGMIRNERKIRGCVENAKIFQTKVEKYGSFRRYVDAYEPKASFDNVMKLRSEIRSRFKYLSKVASLHFLMDIGITVLKPDIVIRRIFDRLGLIESESEDEQNLIESVRVGHKFAQATGHPIRYIDIFFVSYGQMNSTGTGLAQAICVTDNPRCGICGVTDYCQYFRETAKAHAVASHDAYADARVLPGAAWKTIAEKLRKPRAPARG